MRLLILHRIPFDKVRYGAAIDHESHDVTYWGSEKALKTIPAGVRATRLVRDEPRQTVTRQGLHAAGVRGAYDRVLALSEYDLLDAARIRELLGVAGPRVDTVELVRDKVRMKAAAAAAGIRVPRFQSMSECERADWSGKTVLKPRDGASSEGVHTFKSRKEAVQAAHDGSIPDYDGDRYELEEFIEGPIIHIDGLVIDERIVCSVPSRYLGDCLSYARGRPLGSFQLDGTTSVDYAGWAQKCIAAVGIREGAFHLEAIESPEGLVFLEIGHRSGGADVVATFELATGVHLHTANIRIQLGLPFTLPVHRSTERFGWFVLPGHHLAQEHGRVRGSAKLRRSPQVVRWNELGEGQPLPRRITYQATEVPVAGLLRGDSSRAVEAFMKTVFRRIKVTGARPRSGDEAQPVLDFLLCRPRILFS